MRIVIELKRGTVPKKALNRFYKYTPLQTTFAINTLALVNAEPRMLSLKKSLHIYIEHRQEVITRRSRWSLANTAIGPTSSKDCGSPCSFSTR